MYSATPNLEVVGRNDKHMCFCRLAMQSWRKAPQLENFVEVSSLVLLCSELQLAKIAVRAMALKVNNKLNYFLIKINPLCPSSSSGQFDISGHASCTSSMNFLLESAVICLYHVNTNLNIDWGVICESVCGSVTACGVLALKQMVVSQNSRKHSAWSVKFVEKPTVHKQIFRQTSTDLSLWSMNYSHEMIILSLTNNLVLQEKGGRSVPCSFSAPPPLNHNYFSLPPTTWNYDLLPEGILLFIWVGANLN